MNTGKTEYHADVVYLSTAQAILSQGRRKEDRTGTGTISLFAPQMRFDLSKGFPLLTTKRTSLRLIGEELFWFLRGSTNLKELLDKDVNIWNRDAYRFYKETHPNSPFTYEQFLSNAQQYGFDLGPVYGKQMRDFNGVDQIKNLIKGIREQPHSRRHILSLWNPAEIDEGVLPPCHVLVQFYVDGNQLSCHLYQRSGDFFLGIPFNIASYALLTHLIAKMTGLEVGEFVHTVGDAHLYLNHLEAIEEQLTREPRGMPTVTVKVVRENIEDYTLDDIDLSEYYPHPRISAPLSVGLKEDGGEKQ